MKYTFICEDSETEWKTTSEFQAVQIDDIIQNFKYFLKGCSFDSNVVETRFNEYDEYYNFNLNDEEIYSESEISDDTSNKVMSFVVDSLDTWPKDYKTPSADDCPKCKIPMNIIYRHGCLDTFCKHNAN